MFSEFVLSHPSSSILNVDVADDATQLFPLNRINVNVNLCVTSCQRMLSAMSVRRLRTAEVV